MKPKVFGICSKDSNAMKSDNPNSGFYEAETTRTIDTSNQSPCKNQGGMVVIEDNAGHRALAFSPVHGTLSANDGPKGPSSQMLSNPEENFVAEPAYGLDRASFNQGRNAKYDFSVTEESEPTMTARGPNAVAQPVYTTSKASYHTEAAKDVANTLVASDWKDPPTITEEPYYIVRRLTPTECARLQGFPDWWCSHLGTANPSEHDMEFWRGVFETHRRVVSGASKPKSDTQIRKWLASPHSDSAEYKMWGNGIALPCAVYVLSGIVQHAKKH